MKKLAIVAALSLPLTFYLGHRLGSSSADHGIDPRFFDTAQPPRSIVTKSLSEADATEARRSGYREFDSIGQIASLPSYFSRREALYVLAGRSTSGELQDLLFQAVAIEDTWERRGTLQTLLTRLVELDPRSAAAIAESPAVTKAGLSASYVWQAWAREDFDAALAAAAQSRSRTAQLAQTFYRITPAEDRPRQQEIEDTLGHPPNRQTISSWAGILYSESPGRAAAYIEGLEQQHQYTAIRSVAYYIAYQDSGDGPSFASYLTTDRLVEAFQTELITQAASLDPDRAVELVFTNAAAQKNYRVIQGAASRLARTNPDRLDELLALLAPRERDAVVGAAAAALEAEDPLRALEWLTARSSAEPLHSQPTYQRLIAAVAKDDPERAIEEALKLSPPYLSQAAIGTVAFTLLEEDPVRAFSVIETISGQSAKRSKKSELFMAWLSKDESSAVAWYSALPENERAGLFSNMQVQLGIQDREQALRLMPILPEEDARRLRHAMASKLVEREGIDASLAFIEQFKSESDYAALRLQAMSQLAGTDPERALQLAQREPDGESRDLVLMSVTESLSDQDPNRALQVTQQIKSEANRSAAMVIVARTWVRNDPAAAMSWISAEPPGSRKDDLIAGTVYSVADQESADAEKMLFEIGDPKKLKQTGIILAQQMYLRSQDESVELLGKLDLGSEEFEQQLARFERYKKEMRRHGYYP